MISFVKGQLAEVQNGRIIIETGGFGIEVQVPMSVMGDLPRVGEEIKVYTYLKMAEDSMSLYGFNTRRDLEMFEELIGVSGIGPKGALAILSTLTPDELRLAIAAGDAKAISASPGIGPKTAQRVILDLKDKVDFREMLSSGCDISGTGSGMTGSGGARQEAVEALMALGYNSGEAARAIRGLEGDDAETLIKAALKRMAR